MSFFFERNADLYVSDVLSGWNSGNTDKIPLKSGFSFNSEAVLSQVQRNTIKETDSRSLTKYSSKEGLVNFNFSTYINTSQPSTNVEGVDRYLWKALGNYTPGVSFAEIDFTSTNTANAQEITIWVKFPGKTTYRFNQCVITSADVIGTINDLTHISWSGIARSVTNLGDVTINHSELAYDKYTFNKLSTVSMVLNSITYDLPITNYSLNLKNDVFFVYRGKIGQIQTITGQYTGSREISGFVTAYLKTGTNKSMELFEALRSVSNDLENNSANFTIYSGDSSNTHAEFIMPNTVFEVPSNEFNDLITIRIPFFASESSKGLADELTIRYYM